MKNAGSPDTIGTTPGCASIARNGSPKLPGSARVSSRVKTTEPVGVRWPSTMTSSGAVVGRGARRCGGVGCVATLGADACAVGSASDAGGVKCTE